METQLLFATTEPEGGKKSRVKQRISGLTGLDNKNIFFISMFGGAFILNLHAWTLEGEGGV